MNDKKITGNFVVGLLFMKGGSFLKYHTEKLKKGKV